jgi:hypothetical protein
VDERKEETMSVMLEREELKEASTLSLVAVVAIMIVSAIAFTLATAPFAKLLGEHAGAVPAAFHGLAAFLFLFIGTIGLYLGWRLLTGRIRAFADLQLLAVVAATSSLIAIIFGNWLYIYYRAPIPESPRSRAPRRSIESSSSSRSSGRSSRCPSRSWRPTSCGNTEPRCSTGRGFVTRSRC